VYPFITGELTSKKFGMDVGKDGPGDPLEDTLYGGLISRTLEFVESAWLS